MHVPCFVLLCSVLCSFQLCNHLDEEEIYFVCLPGVL